MANERIAKKAAHRKSTQVYRQNIKLPKSSVTKKFANFVGKATYKSALRSGNRKSRRRSPRKRRRR